MGKVENIIKRISEAPPNLAKAGSYEIGDVTYSKDGDTKYTVRDINSETGAVAWKVEQLPAFDKLFDDATELVNTAKGVYTKAKEDKVFRDVYELTKNLRNKIRTHLRGEYPDEYKRMITKLSENDLTENKLISPSKVIALNNKRAEAVTAAIVKEFGIKEELRLKGVIRKALSDFMFDDDLYEVSTSGAAGAYLTPYAFNPNKKAKGTDNDIYTKEFGYKLVKENIETGDGIDLDAYGYKLVPKNKAGNYVQKGSKLDVKQLFEDQKDFQAKRVAAFDVIEQELNDIYKMLSNAKNETSDYYNDNPSSYNVVKPTDLVLDYIKDIKDLLKGE